MGIRGWKCLGSWVLFIVAAWGLTPAAYADLGGFSEPAYCNPTTFLQFEIPNASAGIKGLKRLHAFRLGSVNFAGLAVGESTTSSVVSLAQHYSKADKAEKYCTWYINKGNSQAAKKFNFHYVPNPTKLDETTGPKIYMDTLGSSFDSDSVNFVSCVADFGYLAIGCDGQMHRGPTLFGMILAYSGCTPEHAMEITNGLWGLNGVPPNVRLAIIRAAYDLGREHPVESAKLEKLFSGN